MPELSKQNLYRKYRSKSFAELLGQDHVAKTLQMAVSSGRVSHAYLFSGPRGTGKTSAARLLAKLLNCRSPITVAGGAKDVCCACDICSRIDDLNFLDIIEIDAASNNSVDDIRQIRERVKYTPIEGQYKVYIIDEVHMLSGAAFNAFLKTLEEPPPKVVFVLATTDPQKVPATILSRCQCFEFHPISRKIIIERLSEVARMEREKDPQNFPEIAPEAFYTMAECAQGGFRDALSLLDQITSSFAGGTVSQDHVLEMTRRLGDTTLRNLTRNIFSRDCGNVILQLNDLFIRGYDVGSIGKDLLEYLRKCFLIKIDQNMSQILEILPDNAREIATLVKDLPVEYLMASVSGLERALYGLKGSVHPRIFLELEITRIASRELNLGIEGLERRISQLEDKLKNPIIQTRTTQPHPASATTNLSRTTAPSYKTVAKKTVHTESSVDSTYEKFEKFKSRLFEISKATGAIFQYASLKSMQDQKLVIVMDSDFAANRAKDPHTLQMMQPLITEIFGSAFTLEIIGQSEPKIPSVKDSANKISGVTHQEQIARIDQEVRKKILDKPAVADALAIFGGEIIQIEKK